MSEVIIEVEQKSTHHKAIFPEADFWSFVEDQCEGEQAEAEASSLRAALEKDGTVEGREFIFTRTKTS